MFSLRMGLSFTNSSGGVLMSAFLCEKRNLNLGTILLVVKVIMI